MVKYFQNIATLQKPKEEKVFNHSCVCHGGYHIRRLMINHCYFPLPGLDKLTENSLIE